MQTQNMYELAEHLKQLREKKKNAEQRLKENGCGDLVYETINANSLSAFVKEQIAENQDTVPEWLSGLVHIYEQTSVSVRQSAK